MSKKIYYKDKLYDSVSNFYKENGKNIEVSYASLLENINRGLDIEEAINKQPRKKGWSKVSKHGHITVEGKKYKNLKELADEYDINRNTLFQRHHRGHRGNDLIPLKKRKNYIKPVKETTFRYIVDNKGFNSFNEMSKFYGIKIVTIRARLRRGLSLEEALGFVETPDLRFKKNKNNKVIKKVDDIELIVDGVEYKNMFQLGKKYNINSSTIRSRLLIQGLSAEEAVKKPTDRYKPHVNNLDLKVDGVKYESISELSKAFGLKYYIVYNRLTNYGYTAEEAVKKPTRSEKEKITIRGREFTSLTAAARFYNKVPGNVLSNLNSGFTLEEALGLKKRKYGNYKWKNKVYARKELIDLISKEYNIPKNLLLGRLESGRTIEEAILMGSTKVTGPGRYNLKILERDPVLANTKSELYFVRIYNNSKLFYKIGITTRTTEKRLVNYDFKIIKKHKGKLIDMFIKEQFLLNKFIKNKIGDELEGYFDGKTELLDLNNNEVNEIKAYFNTQK